MKDRVLLAKTMSDASQNSPTAGNRASPQQPSPLADAEVAERGPAASGSSVPSADVDPDGAEVGETVRRIEIYIPTGESVRLEMRGALAADLTRPRLLKKLKVCLATTTITTTTARGSPSDWDDGEEVRVAGGNYVQDVCDFCSKVPTPFLGVVATSDCAAEEETPALGGPPSPRGGDGGSDDLRGTGGSAAGDEEILVCEEPIGVEVSEVRLVALGAGVAKLPWPTDNVELSSDNGRGAEPYAVFAALFGLVKCSDEELDALTTADVGCEPEEAAIYLLRLASDFRLDDFVSPDISVKVLLRRIGAYLRPNIGPACSSWPRALGALFCLDPEVRASLHEDSVTKLVDCLVPAMRIALDAGAKLSVTLYVAGWQQNLCLQSCLQTLAEHVSSTRGSIESLILFRVLPPDPESNPTLSGCRLISKDTARVVARLLAPAGSLVNFHLEGWHLSEESCAELHPILTEGKTCLERLYLTGTEPFQMVVRGLESGALRTLTGLRCGNFYGEKERKINECLSDLARVLASGSSRLKTLVIDTPTEMFGEPDELPSALREAAGSSGVRVLLGCGGDLAKWFDVASGTRVDRPAHGLYGLDALMKDS